MLTRRTTLSIALFVAIGVVLVILQDRRTLAESDASSPQPTRAPFLERSQRPQPQIAIAPAAAPERAGANVRLFHFRSTWSHVLEQLAEVTGTTLVAPQLPEGLYTNTSRAVQTQDAALRVLNDELYEQGYRLSIQGQYLLLLQDDSFRPTFPRYHFGSSQRVDTRPTESHTAPNSYPLRRYQDPAPSSLPAANGSGIRLVSEERTHTNEDDGAAVSAVFEQPNEHDRFVQQPHRQAFIVESTHQSANRIAKTLFEAYGPEATYEEKGPGDLPGFRVQSERSGTPTSFGIGVNNLDHRLHVEADPKDARSIRELIDHLDQPALRGQAPKLRAADTATRRVATRLPTVVGQMLAMQTDERPGELPPPEADADDVTSMLDRLKSNVNIEAIDDLGLLILRGNEADVEATMQIIESIEKMSVGTTPEVHLRRLQSVDGQALGTLLNDVYAAVQSIETRPGRTQKSLTVVPVVRPNAVLIIAPAVELQSALALIDELDKPVDPENEVRLIQLENATAQSAVDLLTEFYSERGGLGTRVRVSADARTNSIIVQTRPNDLTEIELLVGRLDSEQSRSVSRLQVFPLENASAEELADFLNAALSDALTARDGGDGVNKSIILEFLSEAEATTLLRSGGLADIRISADPRTNSLAVVAPTASLPILEALIKTFDRPSAATAEVKAFTLEKADASAAVELLVELFENTGNESPDGIQLAGADDAASNLVPVRFSVDVRTNTVLAVGGPDALTIVEAILLRLDSSDIRQRYNQVIPLKHSPAEDVAIAINDFLETQRTLAEANPDLTTTIELIDREVIVVAEPLGNSLLISATADTLAEIVRLVQELDSQPEQVVIQALIVEVELDNTDEFGVELGFQDSILFDRSIVENILTVTDTVTGVNGQTQTTERIVSQEGGPGFLFNNPTIFPNLGNNIGAPSNNVGGQGLSNFGVGRINSELGFGGLVLSASSESVSVLVRALSQQRTVHVLSRPQVRTVDGELAEIQVGQSVPIINGVTIGTTGVAQPQIEYDESGIILSVRPRINADGQIIMEVVAERSNFDSNGVPIFTDITTGSVISSPIKNVTVARSTVSVANGQTAVLGGMITQSDEKVQRRVPYLSEIPILGHAFRFDSANNVRTELLIFLTPRVIASDFDNEMINQVEAERLHFFQEEAEAIHGPIFGLYEGPEEVFPPDFYSDDMVPVAPTPMEDVPPIDVIRIEDADRFQPEEYVTPVLPSLSPAEEVR